VKGSRNHSQDDRDEDRSAHRIAGADCTVPTPTQLYVAVCQFPWSPLGQGNGSWAFLLTSAFKATALNYYTSFRKDEMNFILSIINISNGRKVIPFYK